MKKLIVILLALTLIVVSVFGLTACNNDGTIVVYTEAGFAPFEYISNGQIVGVDVDIMNKVGEKLGKKVVFESVDFDKIIDAVSAGKLCNVGAAGISVTEERAKKVDFSTNYYTAALYVIYKVSDATAYENETTDEVTGVYWDNLAGKKIAVQSGTTADLFLADELDEGGTLDGTGATDVQFKELAAAIADIKLGNSDVLIIDELPAKKLVENESTLTCAPLYYQGGEGEEDEAAVDVYSICVTKGQPELLAAINEVIEELGKDGIQALVNHHLGLDD
ncbi:MAG: transporter substrate-binding domain-containing protein [Clostridiales bacterium]|nr:transporter substrate-binding domain-containing protein [Clostridiales bacterium]